MSFFRIFLRLIITLGCAFVVACVFTAVQAYRIVGRPSQFCSVAKLIGGGQAVSNDNIDWQEQQEDFYGMIIETIESAEMKSRALERVKALNPDLEESDVAIRANRTKGSAIINILATGAEPKYTKIFLDALIDEFIALRQALREQAQGRSLQDFLVEVVSRQKKMEESLEALVKVDAKVDSLNSLSTKSDQERLLTRLNTVRNQRDDLRLEINSLDASDAARPPLEAKRSAYEQEIQRIETELKSHESDLSELRTLTEKATMDKLTYDKLFEQVEKIQSSFNASPDNVAVQERATPAFEIVEEWRRPVALVAVGGGLIGLVLSFLLVSSPKPPRMPAAVG